MADSTPPSSASASLPGFCPSGDPSSDYADPSSASNPWWSNLPDPAARTFFERLDLPTVHPHCLGHDGFEGLNGLDGMGAPPLYGPDDGASGEEGAALERIVTLYSQAAPALLAMTELWLRLFALVLAPLAVVYLLVDERRSRRGDALKEDEDDDDEEATRKRKRRTASLTSVLGLSSAAVLLTDSMYVHDMGRLPGAVLFVLLSVLSTRAYLRGSLPGRSLTILFAIKAVAAICLVRSDGHPDSHLVGIGDEPGAGGRAGWDSAPHPGVDLPTIPEGLYHSPRNALLSSIASRWPEESRTYSVENGATPWLRTGDSRTGIPFLVNGAPPLPKADVGPGGSSSPSGSYHRLWVPTPDGESVALDIALPPSGVHSPTKPIILSNYVARSGTSCNLDAAMAVSGGLDMREQLNFYRSMRLWQPMLAKTLRDVFIVGKFEGRYRARLDGGQWRSLMRAAHISSIDDHAVVTYNSFDDLTHYYSEMSAMGDTAAFRSPASSSRGNSTSPAVAAAAATAAPTAKAEEESNTGNNNEDDNDDDALGRISKVSIPFCVLHALDDPLVTWRTMGRDPQRLVESGSGNLMLLLTKSGGHVGWPLGWNPRREGWRWMNDAVRDFVDAADAALREERRRNRSGGDGDDDCDDGGDGGGGDVAEEKGDDPRRA